MSQQSPDGHLVGSHLQVVPLQIWVAEQPGPPPQLHPPSAPQLLPRVPQSVHTAPSAAQ